MTEEDLDVPELEDRVWAILAAAGDNRPDDVSELLETLPWSDLVTVVFGVAELNVRLMSGGDEQARGRLVERMRAHLLERAGQRGQTGADG